MADAHRPVEVAETTEAQIAVHWKEEEYYSPPASFVAQANLKDPAVNDGFAEKNFPKCFEEFAELLAWDKKWDTVLDTSEAPFWKWFVGGKLNVSRNCIDRHLAKYTNKAALISVPSSRKRATVTVTYQELYVRVNEFAALLRDFAGLKAETASRSTCRCCRSLPITMLACARLGVIHSVVFGGFSGEACGLRAADSGSRVLIYMDAYYRSGKLIDHKPGAVETAVAAAKANGQPVDKVLVWRRRPGKSSSEAPMVEGRDFFVDDLLRTTGASESSPSPWMRTTRSS